jgi:hypothetical protein
VDPVDWNTIAKTAREAFRDGVNDWIGMARIRGGQVNGPNAMLTPGSLASDANLESTIFQKLTVAQAPPDVARSLARELAAAWNGWAAGFQMPLPGAYPTLAAFPGPLAPPTPTIRPMPLAAGVSSGEVGLKAVVLLPRLAQALQPYTMRFRGSSPDEALKVLATWIETSFVEWKNMAMLTGVLGKGPVPTFAPPYVPVGPVVRGDMHSAGAVFAGPRFGRIAI